MPDTPLDALDLGSLYCTAPPYSGQTNYFGLFISELGADYDGFSYTETYPRRCLK